MDYVSFPGLGITINVSPTAFKIGSVEIKWYALCIMLGFALAIVYVLVQGKKQGFKSDIFIDLAIIAMVFGLIGARLYYVLFRLDQYIKDPISILYIWKGGLAIYGGVILAVLASFVYCRVKKQPFLKLADIAAPALLIGQGIGRWGNFFNQEAFGVNTGLPWGMTGNIVAENIRSEAADIKDRFGILLDSSKPVHPTFLYESLWCLIGVLVLWLFYKKFKKFDGEVALAYCAWYGFERMFVEGLRTDSLILFANIRISQVVAAVTFVTAVVLIIVFRIKSKRGKRGKSLSQEDDDSLIIDIPTEDAE
ncbi:MAG: prolipoprotein diacylglyceryl transferase [Clostridia bacterium]|nr:prolipoprotein diacylglyceryl transferase [Clostridia bacterium]